MGKRAKITFVRVKPFLVSVWSSHLAFDHTTPYRTTSQHFTIGSFHMKCVRLVTNMAEIHIPCDISSIGLSNIRNCFDFSFSSSNLIELYGKGMNVSHSQLYGMIDVTSSVLDLFRVWVCVARANLYTFFPPHLFHTITCAMRLIFLLLCCWMGLTFAAAIYFMQTKKSWP